MIYSERTACIKSALSEYYRVKGGTFILKAELYFVIIITILFILSPLPSEISNESNHAPFVLSRMNDCIILVHFLPFMHREHSDEASLKKLTLRHEASANSASREKAP